MKPEFISLDCVRNSPTKYHTPTPNLKNLGSVFHLANRVEGLGFSLSMAVFALSEDALACGTYS